MQNIAKMVNSLEFLLISILTKSVLSEPTSPIRQEFETVDFAHETCQRETLSSKNFKTFYPTERFYNEYGVLELLVRFMGVADGHIALTSNASDSEPRYTISLGSYNNKVSEIRRGNPTNIEFRMNTPGILSDRQYRGFIIRYNENSGALWVFSEGSEIPLLHLVDPDPLDIDYFSFATWTSRVVQTAFNCQPKDTHSYVIKKSDASLNINRSK